MKGLIRFFSALLIFQTGLAVGYYDPYGGYNHSYSSFGRSTPSPVISLDFNDKDILNSSFRIAAREGRLTDVQTDLLQGAEINSRGDEGETALMYAARNCTIEVASLLLRSKANPNILDDQGKSALVYAVIESCLPIVRMLLRTRSINLNVEDHAKKTVFFYAEDAASLDVDGPSVKIKRLLHHAYLSKH